ncbi:MAG TPA: hypothetical protein VIX58_02950 [Anaerolineae bacterium]
MFDTTRGRVVLFGGQGGTSLASDTWEYDGPQWKVAADTGPGARAGYGLIWNSAEVWLFGGQGEVFERPTSQAE